MHGSLGLVADIRIGTAIQPRYAKQPTARKMGTSPPGFPRGRMCPFCVRNTTPRLTALRTACLPRTDAEAGVLNFTPYPEGLFAPDACCMLRVQATAAFRNRRSPHSPEGCLRALMLPRHTPKQRNRLCPCPFLHCGGASGAAWALTAPARFPPPAPAPAHPLPAHRHRRHRPAMPPRSYPGECSHPG